MLERLADSTPSAEALSMVVSPAEEEELESARLHTAQGSHDEKRNRHHDQGSFNDTTWRTLQGGYWPRRSAPWVLCRHAGWQSFQRRSSHVNV